jgi:hypothetical protein
VKVTLADKPWHPTPPGWWKSPVPPRPRGEILWRLVRDGHTLSCELRDGSRSGAGWDVLVLEDDEVSFSRRCETEGLAWYVADGQKQDRVKAGWVDA